MPELLRIDDLSAGYGEAVVLSGVSLALPMGETLAGALHKRLEAEIAAGRIEPGSRLDEQEIAERHGLWMHVDGAYGGAKSMVAICWQTASTMRGRAWPALQHQRPPVPSRISRPWTSL